jgi:hypothetical protein
VVVVATSARDHILGLLDKLLVLVAVLAGDEGVNPLVFTFGLGCWGPLDVLSLPFMLSAGLVNCC